MSVYAPVIGGRGREPNPLPPPVFKTLRGRYEKADNIQDVAKALHQPGEQ